MARDFIVNGETLVKVKGFLLSGPNLGYEELGLADGPVRVTPRFVYRELHTDDFGPEVPAEVMTMLAEVRIRMTLVHYDPAVLDACVGESLGGALDVGTLVPAGTPLGGGALRFTSGNHYISLNLLSPVLGAPWRFFSTYLDAQPLDIPLGTDRTLVQLSWRAIPYQLPGVSSGNPVLPLVGNQFLPGMEILSSGARLWDREEDTDVNP